MVGALSLGSPERDSTTPTSWSWLAPILVAAVLLSVALGRGSPLDGHEVLVAQTAKEMLESGDRLHPRFAGQPRYQKPPLAYWTTAAAYRLTGQRTPASARLPSVLATLVTVGMVAWFSARVFGSTAGLLAGLVHATTWWVIQYGQHATVDATLAAIVTGAILLAGLARGGQTRIRWPLWPVGFWTLVGLVVLAKGPVGAILILTTVLAHRVLCRPKLPDRPIPRTWSLWPGPVVFLLLALAWPVAILCHHPEVSSLWYEQSVARFLHHWGPQTRPWYFYLYQVPALTLPWSIAWLYEGASSLPIGRRRQAQGDESHDGESKRRDARLLLWVWLGVGVLLFSLSQGKRAHYVLPCLPPLSILAALGLLRWARADLCQAHGTESMPAAVPVHGKGCPETGTGSPKWDGLASPSMRRRRPGKAVPPFRYAVPVPVSGQPLTRTRRLRVLGLGVAAACLALIVHETLWMPRLHQHAGALALFERNRRLLDAAPCVLQFGSTDRWAIFPIDRLMRWPRTIEALHDELRRQPRALLLVTADQLESALHHTGGLVIDRADFSPADAPPTSLVLVLPPDPTRTPHLARHHPHSDGQR